MVSGADVILNILDQYGIEALFTSPIAALAPLWEALAKRDALTPGKGPIYYNVRHEIVAVSLAIGYFKSTGKMAAVCLPTGLGVLNGSMALRMARQERIPMLVISPDTLTFGEDPSRDPGPEWGTFLIDDHGPAQLAKQTTKWSIPCRTNIDLIPNLHRAIYFAQQLPRGPTLVEIPFDIMMNSFDQVPDRFPAPIVSDNVQASDEYLKEIAELLFAAKFPIIVTEHFGSSARHVAALTSFAEALGAPVFEWWMPSYQNIKRSHPLHPISPCEATLSEADVIISLCAHGPWHSPDQKLHPQVRVVVIEEDPMRPRSAYWGYATTDCLSGCPLANVVSVTAKIVGLFDKDKDKDKDKSLQVARRTLEWAKRNKAEKIAFEANAAHEASKAQTAAAGRVLHASVFFSALQSVLPSGSIIVDEIVAQVPLFTHFMFRDETKNFVHLRGWQGGLGTGMGVALGAKLANPDKMVVFVVGDGALNYNALPASFGFAQQYNCPILITVMNNSGYISQTWNFYKHFPQGYALSTRNTLGNVIEPSPKYSILPLAWGGSGIEVSDSSDEDSLKKGVFKEFLGTGGQLQLKNTLLLDIKVTP